MTEEKLSLFGALGVPRVSNPDASTTTRAAEVHVEGQRKRLADEAAPIDGPHAPKAAATGAEDALAGTARTPAPSSAPPPPPPPSVPAPPHASTPRTGSGHDSGNQLCWWEEWGSYDDYVVARGWVTDAAALLGPGGSRLNQLRSHHPNVKIQLLDGDRRELIIRGQGRYAFPLAVTLYQQSRIWLNIVPWGAHYHQEPRPALSSREPLSMTSAAVAGLEETRRLEAMRRPSLAGVFVAAARGAPSLVAAMEANVPCPSEEAQQHQPADGQMRYTKPSATRPIAKAQHRKCNRNHGRDGGRRVEWSAAEEAALRRGVDKHGFGNWAAILADGGFHSSRTNVKLKDKARTMGILR